MTSQDVVDILDPKDPLFLRPLDNENVDRPILHVLHFFRFGVKPLLVLASRAATRFGPAFFSALGPPAPRTPDAASLLPGLLAATRAGLAPGQVPALLGTRKTGLASRQATL